MHAVLQLVFPIPQYGQLSERKTLELHFSNDQGWTQDSLRASLERVTLDGTDYLVENVSIQLTKFEVTLRSA